MLEGGNRDDSGLDPCDGYRAACPEFPGRVEGRPLLQGRSRADGDAAAVTVAA